MKGKTIIILLAVCLVLGIAAYFTLKSNSGAKPRDMMGEALFPDFPVNRISKITITSEEDTVSLIKKDNLWQVESRYGYPADFKKIRDFVTKITGLEIARSFTGNKAIYERNSLVPPEEHAKKEKPPAGESGIRVKFADAGGKNLADFVIGSAREKGQGNYIRIMGKPLVFVVDKSFGYVSKKPTDWMEKEILQADREEIEKLTCSKPGADKPLFIIRRPEKGKDPRLMQAPEGRTVETNKVKNTLTAISSVRMEDVADPELTPEEAGIADSPCLTYSLYNGTIYRVYPGKAKDSENKSYYVKLEADFTEKPAPSFEETEAQETPAGDAPAQEDSAEDANPASDKDAEKEKAAQKAREEWEKKNQQLRKKAENLNQELQNWIFIVPQWKYDYFVTDMEELLAQEKEEEETPSGG